MTDEKKSVDLDAGGAETGTRAPDEARRKLAKAALASPVIMTLAPRSVLGQLAPGPCTTSVLTSATPAGGSVSAAVQECLECQKDYIAHCPSDAENAAAMCEASSNPSCPPTQTDTTLLDPAPVK